jgi:hypothetical protein
VNKRSIFVLCILLVVSCSIVSCSSSESEAVELNKSIERNLPRGSSYDSVVRFMEQRGYEYTHQEVEGYDPSGSYGRQHVLTGTRIRYVLGMEQSKVQVSFYFNEDRQLSGSVVTPGKS